MGVTYALATESAAPRCFAERVRPGMTVYDVGANRGQMALLFASLVGSSGRVVSLEPAPVPFEALERNIALNGLNTVRALNVAAADAEGELAFTFEPDRPTQGKLIAVEPSYEVNGDPFTVRALPLDRVLTEEPAPDVVKVDVEGAAASVFRGAARILENARPAFYVELHGPEEQRGVRDEVLSRGYTAVTLDGREVADPTAGWHSPLWCVPA